MAKVSPSILAADLSRLEDEIKGIENVVDYIHLDVMDGHFVPNLTFGFPIAEAVKRITDKPLDVHLMVTNPGDLVPRFLEIGVGIIAVHFEVCYNLYRTVNYIRSSDAKAFVAINPQTTVENLIDILPYIDGVLVMSVNPGFSGQRFIERSVDKIERLRRLADELNPDLEIAVDGGVGPENAKELVRAGANIMVMGSAVFKAEDPKKVCEKVRAL